MKQRVLSNLIWRFAERSGQQLVQLVVSIILARLIEPEAFGTIAIVLVITNILQVFIDSGIGNALIQNKDSDELDFSSVFYFNIVWCIGLYFIAFFLAPFVAYFYDDPKLTLIIRVLSLILIISGVKNIEQAYVSKTLQFKKFFFSTLGGTLVSAIIGIWFAVAGLGVWALVAQKLINIAIDTIILFFSIEWRPKKEFSFFRIKKAFKFAWKILLTQLLDYFYLDFQQLIIGKIYSPTVLAFYSRGKQFPQIIVQNINTSIDSVLFPVMSIKQDNNLEVKQMLKKSIKTSTYIMAPLMVGLMIIAPEIVTLLLTDKWLDCVIFLRVFCINYMFQHINTYNMNAIKALGRSDILLKIEVVKKILCITILLGTMWISVEMMLVGLLLSSLITQVMNALPSKKLLEYGYIEQIQDILPGIAVSILMGIAIYLVSLINLPIVILLILQILIGGIIYVSVSEIYKVDTYIFLKKMIINFFKEKYNRK